MAGLKLEVQRSNLEGQNSWIQFNLVDRLRLKDVSIVLNQSLGLAIRSFPETQLH
jgi:hypothetical protein